MSKETFLQKWTRVIEHGSAGKGPAVKVERIGDATLYLGDSRELVNELVDYDVLITDPPYGVNLGEHHGAEECRAGFLVKDGYDSYVDSLENFGADIAPTIIRALDYAKRGLVFCSDKGAWLLPPPDAIGGVYMPAAVGRCAWGFQSLAHAFLYGKAPDLQKGAKPTAIRSTALAEKNGHPCPKPLDWMVWAVDLASRKGEVVFDPFMGSGTTGAACLLHGRAFIGIEREPRYFDIACRRIEQTYKQRPLFDAEPQRKPEQVEIGL